MNYVWAFSEIYVPPVRHFQFAHDTPCLPPKIFHHYSVQFLGITVIPSLLVEVSHGKMKNDRKKKDLCRPRLFPFRKRSLPFLTVDAIIGNQAFMIDVI